MRAWTRSLILVPLTAVLLAGCSLPAGSKPYVFLDQYNRLIVNEAPFFPIGLYWVPTIDMAEVADCGFNLVHGYVNESQPPLPPENDARLPFCDFLDAAESNGLKAVFSFLPENIENLENGTYGWSVLEAALYATREHPSIIANKIMDEPENYFYYDENGVYHLRPYAEPSFLRGVDRHIRACDPDRPTQLSHYHPGVFETFAGAAGIMDIDLYPILENSDASAAHKVADWTDAAVLAMAGRGPVWVTLQAFGNWDNLPEGGRFPTRAELRYMTYLSLVHGAQGITYFRWEREPAEGGVQNQELHDAVIQMGGELSILAPALLSPRTVRDPALCDDPDVETMVKIHGNATYVIAVYNGPGPRSVHFNIAGDGREFPVLFEARNITHGQNGFDDDFTMYGVHVYQIPD